MTNRVELSRPYDEKGTLLWTRTPNCLLNALLGGIHNFTETRILLYLCRMTYGFQNKEETYYLSLEDFVKETGIKKPHLSKAIKKLLDKYVIFRYNKSSDKYIYAINLLPYHVEMKHFRYGKPNYESGDGVYEIGSIDYGFRNFKDTDEDVIVYNKKGYGKGIEADINTNINTNKNINKESSAYADIIPNVVPKKEKEEREKREQLKDSIIISFREEMERAPSLETVLKYMKKMEENKLPPGEIGYACCTIKREGETYKHFSSEAMRIYLNKEKEK